MARPLEDVYCTLVMSDSYLPGAAVLSHSLRDAGTSKKLAALITLDTLSADTIGELKLLYDYLIPVERIRNPHPANLFLMGRPDLLFAFTKIALWRQTQFRKIVYLDADIVALRALDELFDIDASFAAAPDIGWPDAFNTGVMVIKPDMGEYWALQTLAATGDSFDGADQGLLNQYFEHRPWHRLKFTYNCTPNAQYQWEPAYRYHKRDIAAVHFIGKDKPWTGSHSGGGGVYNELLARWWAVHDRHLKKPPAPSPGAVPQLSSGADHGTSANVQQHGQGEGSDANTGAPSSTPPPTIVVEPEAPLITTEPPFTEPGEEAENIDQGLVAPVPLVQQSRFSAPQMEWDATRSEPPIESKPEAANFPNETYTFSDNHELFKAPQAYPEPPKDMWYKVPESKPTPAAPPKPIFPWEQHSDRPKASRIFAEDIPPQPTPAEAPTPPSQPSPTHPFSTVHYEDNGQQRAEVEAAGPTSPQVIASPKSADEQWQEFQQNSVNAWDSVPGIDTYVRAIMDAQTRRGKPQALSLTTDTTDIGSPSLSRGNRRESLIITDFPTAVERPSLPVTPAPIRRPTFWGEERDEAGQLPAAEGVPDQAEWVCPQCGFSSVSASDFIRRRESSASTTTAVATPLPRPVSETLPKPALAISTSISEASESSVPKVDLPKAELPKSDPPTADPPKRDTTKPITPLSKQSTKSIVSPIPHARSGLSASGVPLASLTDPALLTSQPHLPEHSDPPSSAFTLQSTSTTITST